MLEVVRVRCDLAAAAASLACVVAKRSTADCVCFRGETPEEVIDEAGEVDKMASALTSADVDVVSTMDVGLDRVVGNANLGVRDDGGLDDMVDVCGASRMSPCDARLG